MMTAQAKHALSAITVVSLAPVPVHPSAIPALTPAIEPLISTHAFAPHATMMTAAMKSVAIAITLVTLVAVVQTPIA